MSNKSVHVTGIAGFLGSHLAEALIEQGCDVSGNDNYLCGFEKNVPDAANGYNIDCRDYRGMKYMFDLYKPDTVVHAAATAHEGLSVFSPSFITKNIYEASVTTFSAAIASGHVKHIIYMSSMSRYGKGVPYGPPFIEDVHWPMPEDPYAAAKVAAEQTLKMLCKTHGVNWTILVPHNIVGPRQNYQDPHRNVASIMMNRCMKGQAPIIYGDGKQTRCFSPIDDCIDSLVKATLEEAAVGETVNIGPDGGEISINKLSRMIRGITGLDIDPEYFPDRPCEVKEAFCASDKARKLLGYEPKKDLYECLREMYQEMKADGAPKDFIYDFPLEIVTDKTPLTWKNKLI